MVNVKGGKALTKTVYGIPDGNYYTVSEYCIVYNLQEATVRKWKERGHIRTVTIFGKLYIPETEAPHDGKNGRPRRRKT